MSEFKNSLHITLQPKGGAGKSHAARLIGEYLSKAFPNEVVIKDSDENNHSLLQYLGLQAKAIDELFINIGDAEIGIEKQFNSEYMNAVELEEIINAKYPICMDTGASNYQNFVQLFKNQNWFAVLNEYAPEKKVFIHVPVSGLQEMTAACVAGLIEIVNLFGEYENVHFIVWEHSAQNDVILLNGVPYKESNAFKKIENRIAGIVYVPLDVKSYAYKAWSKTFSHKMTTNEIQYGFSVRDVINVLAEFSKWKAKAGWNDDLEWDMIEAEMTDDVVNFLTNLADDPFGFPLTFEDKTAARKAISEILKEVLPLFKISNEVNEIQRVERMEIIKVANAYYKRLADVIENC